MSRFRCLLAKSPLRSFSPLHAWHASIGEIKGTRILVAFLVALTDRRRRVVDVTGRTLTTIVSPRGASKITELSPGEIKKPSSVQSSMLSVLMEAENHGASQNILTTASAVPLTVVASRGTRKRMRRVFVANGGGKISFNFIAYVKSEKYYTTLLARSENLGAFMSLFSTP